MPSDRPLNFVKLAIALVMTLMVLVGYYVVEYGDESMKPKPFSKQLRENLVGTIPRIESNSSRVLLFMIDGLAVQPFETALAKNLLPNFSQIMQSRPTVKTQAISTFPSATSPSVPELVSGRYAEIENLAAPGAVHAFDREQRRVIRYATDPDSWQWPVVTLFDATRHLPAITIFEGRWDGPKSILTQYYMAKQAVFEFLGVHDLAEGDRGPVDAFLKAVRSPDPPSVSLLVLNDFDMASHFYGPESMEARNALIAADSYLGQILDLLGHTRGSHKPSMLDETNIIFFGDHGQVSSGQFVDLVSFFKEKNLKAVDVSTIPHVVFRERLGTLWTEWPDVILVSGGSNIAQIYLKQLSGSWQKQGNSNKSHENNNSNNNLDLKTLATDITHAKGIDQVLWVDKNGDTNVLSNDNKFARIKVKTDTQEKRFAYIISDSAEQDPFDYLANADTHSLVCRESQLNDGCFHSRAEWFDRTFNSRYPGAVPLIPKAFHPERFTGDLMITLEPGYSFIRGQKGDHGNLIREAILTPLIINGPGIVPRLESQRPKLVDLYPSVAVLLGASPDDPAFVGLDGRVLDCVKPGMSQ
ncbi:alkaline phosphatase family protein [Kaarinaea lacus]